MVQEIGRPVRVPRLSLARAARAASARFFSTTRFYRSIVSVLLMSRKNCVKSAIRQPDAVDVLAMPTPDPPLDLNRHLGVILAILSSKGIWIISVQ